MKLNKLVIGSNLNLKSCYYIFLVVLTTTFLHACGEAAKNSDHDHPKEIIEKGEHNGRLLKDKNFTLELAIFEIGVPPEYRAWAYMDDKQVKPNDVNLQVRLTRLGNKIDVINFAPEADFLRGKSVIYEPHSFSVSIEASYKGTSHRWKFDSFEGRTRIEPEVAKALNIQTQIATTAILKETVQVFGRIAADPILEREINARFDGPITHVGVVLGQTVKAGQSLFSIESNESLRNYEVNAPIAGVITRLDAKTGQQTRGTSLAKIVDNSRTIIELEIFPSQLNRVKTGADVSIVFQNEELSTTIERIALETNSNQSVTAHASLNKSLPIGAQISAQIQVDKYEVPIAVKRAGLQTFRDFTVVYAKVGNEYEVRMLELGREAGDWVEVLDGLDPGTEYVTENSFVIKADIEKSGASHDH